MNRISYKVDKDGYIETSSIKQKKNVPYAQISNRQCFDIYYPDRKQDRYPTIVFVHGGGLIKGDKGRYQLLPALSWLQEGYAVVSMNYRLLPQATFVDAVEDVIKAITYLTQYGEELHIDSTQIVLWGESLGASLVVQAITRMEKIDGIRLVIDWYGSVNLNSIDEQMRMNDDFETEVYKLHRRKFGDISDDQYHLLTQEYNPLAHLHSSLPAFLIEHGNQDHVVPVAQSMEFYEALLEVLPPSMVHCKVLDKATHCVQDFSSEENLTYLSTLITKYVKNC